MSARRSWMIGSERLARALVAFGLVAAGMAGAACAPEPPSLVLNVQAGTQPLSDLARLQLIARSCGDTGLGVRTNLSFSNSQATTHELEAAIAPGKIFYVWLQGWQGCVPAETGCVPETSAHPGDCTCIEGGATQILVSEACTPWLRAQEGSTEVRLTLGPVANLCPPEPLTDCSKLP